MTRFALCAIGPVFGMLVATGAHAAVILGTPQPLFTGIDLRTVQVDASQGVVARVDLSAPGIGVTGSAPAPQGVTIPGTKPPAQAETVAQTTSQFLLGTGTQYAINAGFFAPCCTAANEGKDISGLTVSNGVVVSPLDPTRPASLVISADNHAAVGLVTSLPANVADAVTGSDILVRGGQNVAPTASTDFNNANPRTAAGVSQDGRTLYLLTIDGRQPGYSPGASLVETASVFLALGADAAVNLDGGGSTVAVAANGAGGATVLNRPSGGTERFDAASLGIFALPLPVAVPEPASFLLLMVALAGLWATRRIA